MRWYAALALLALLPGCAAPPPADGALPNELRAFKAEYRNADGLTVNVSLDGPASYYRHDGSIGSGYRFTEQMPWDLWWGVGPTQWFLASDLRPVMRRDPCVEYGEGRCWMSSARWHNLTESSFSPFMELLRADLPRGKLACASEGREASCAYDGQLLPVRIEDAEGTTSWERVSLEQGAALDGAVDDWNEGLFMPVTEGWQNPLFPGADVDLFGAGFTPLEALDYVRTTSPRAAATLASGGCVTESHFRDRRGDVSVDASGEVIEVDFLVEDVRGAQVRYSIDWSQGLTGPAFGWRFLSGPVGSGKFVAATSCAQRTATPWPLSSPLPLLNIAAKWPAPSEWRPIELRIGESRFQGLHLPSWGPEPSLLTYEYHGGYDSRWMTFDPHFGGFWLMQLPPNTVEL